jgi:protein tyrosine/serine phosphatase
LAAGVALLVAGPPIALFRAQYAHAKRFREVSPGRFYRSGQMTAAGFREMIDRHGIKTVINLQNEDPDPLLRERWFGKPYLPESELCKQLGVNYHLLEPDILPEPNSLDKRPPVLDAYLAILDDESAYPVLLHCKAGLHRTGRLTAIYRMEYEGWSVGEAMRELRANGYGFIMSSEEDNYVIQYIQNYKPRTPAERDAARARATKAGPRGGEK